MNAPLPHRVIAASAGSGKTFQLAHRMIRLLADGVPPDRIAALTFSRKAAGEIFESVIDYVRRAAASEREAEAAAARIERPGTRPADFLHILRRRIDHMPRLRIGTLDSFIVGIVRAFPAELGVPADVRVTDEHGPGADDLMRNVLARLLNPSLVDRRTQRDFFESFKLATFGHEEKRLETALIRFVEEYRGVYRLLPNPDLWGAPEAVWPRGCPWPRDARGLPESAESARAHARRHNWPEAMLAGFEKTLNFMAAYDESARWNTDVEKITLFEQILALARDPAGAALTYRKKDYPLSPEASVALGKLARHVIGVEVHRALRQTRGICRVLERVDALYDTLMRQTGVLTFSDAHFLLTAGNARSGGRVPSRSSEGENRLYIDYRLDCRLDHWLIDEFQDTSDLQWAALRNLVSELIQDDSGQRSFFYVGDVKQAIYRWRGGNPRLFHEVLRDFGPRLERRDLTQSFRSCPPVIEAVNRVFGALPDDVPAGARAAWEETFAPHTSADKPAALSGVAALVEPETPEGESKPSDEDVGDLAAALLRRLRPLERGLSAAVLVRSNEAGRDLVDRLRRTCPGLPVVLEGAATITDNPVVSLLLALLKFAAHPGDTLAWRHIQMSPLAGVLEHGDADGVPCRLTRQEREIGGDRECSPPISFTRDARSRGSRDRLVLDLLRDLHEDGFQTLFRKWGRRLDAHAPLDPYGRRRWNDLLEAAGLFDRTGARDADAFLRFIERHQTRDAAEAGAVRVMTIHQSKGLGFDVVVLPDLMGRDITRADGPAFVMERDPATHLPAWMLKMPRRIVARVDPRLARLLEEADGRACFDELCVLYVALTRAKRGLYMLTRFPGPSATSYNAAALLKTQLLEGGEPRPMDLDGPRASVLYTAGDWDWFESVPLRDATAAAAEGETEPPGGRRSGAAVPAGLAQPAPLRPSAADERVRKGAWCFDAETRDVLDFGQAIHELFYAVTWSGVEDVEALLEAWQVASPYAAEVRRDAADQFRAALEAPAVRDLLAKPTGPVRLWREKAFDVVLDGRRVTGAFDRVAIRDDAQGRALDACVVDYKSDRVATPAEIRAAAESHRTQLDLYARALSAILGLPEDRIEKRLVFTRPAQVVRV
jgi:ATP-dependent helicase/nuclease subunit A